MSHFICLESYLPPWYHLSYKYIFFSLTEDFVMQRMSVQEVMKNLFATDDWNSSEDEDDVENELNWYEHEQND